MSPPPDMRIVVAFIVEKVLGLVEVLRNMARAQKRLEKAEGRNLKLRHV